MNKILSLTILQVFLISLSYGQVFQPSKEKLYQSLTDEVFILTLFVDTRYDAWDLDEIDYAYGLLQKSESWLIDQADQYEKDLEFNNDFFSDNQSNIYLETVSHGRNPKQTIQRVMEELRYDDFDDFITNNHFDFKNQKLKILLFVKENSRSHAYNYWSNSDVDLAVVYYSSSYGMLTNEYVVSHELLHQFGAWDLYAGKSQSIENAERAFELYPNSIMINTWKNQENLEVDELTAWRVGWTYDFEEVYNTFDPIHSKNNTGIKRKRGKSIEFDLKKKQKNKNEK